MHPNRNFREDDAAFYRKLVDEVGFAMVFCSTPEGPRVAHTPIVMVGDGRLQFHLARGNAVTRHVTESDALIVVNGVDAYISARWYSEPDQVPTWNYLAGEMEGPVARLDGDALLDLLARLSEREEARIAEGTPWTMDKMSPARRDGLLKGIVGFEMTVTTWRSTVKLSQNKPLAEREEMIAGLETQGSMDMAHAMRGAGL